MTPRSSSQDLTSSVETVLLAQDIYKSFSVPETISILRGVNLAVTKGESIAIIGASGQGKSTLLQILGALDTPNQGNLFIQNQKVTKSNSARIRNQYIGYMFQAFYLLEDKTILENVLMPARIARKDTRPGSDAYIYIEGILEQLGLGHRKHFHTRLLSGGEKQRVALARALCNQPALIIADEPTGSLDDANAEELYQLLYHQVSSEKKSLIVATHHLEFASRCQHIYELKEGMLYPVK